MRTIPTEATSESTGRFQLGKGTGMRYPASDEDWQRGDVVTTGEVDEAAFHANVAKEQEGQEEFDRLLRAAAVTDDPAAPVEITAEMHEVAGRMLQARDAWRAALRPPKRPIRRTARRPRPRGAGRPACSRHTRRTAASSPSSGTDPGDDGPAASHSRRPRRARGRWDSC